MNKKRWAEVDGYFADALLPQDAGLTAALAANSKYGLPAIDVSPLQGRLLHLFVLMLGARRVLEIGTLGGYSTLCMAGALPAGGVLVSLEADKAHADVARANIERAGFGKVVHIVTGKALQTLPRVAARWKEPFDLVFIDADKVNTTGYFKWALKLSRPGTVIIADNVVRKGEIANPDNPDAAVLGMRRFIAKLSRETRVTSTVIQTVGLKGYDGFAIARVGGA